MADYSAIKKMLEQILIFQLTAETTESLIMELG